MEKIIEIPEGYEARIEGNKVVLEPKESEDERIRQRLINLIGELANAKLPILTSGYFVDGQDKKYIAWLEKQKEHKSLNISAASEWLREHASRYMNSEYNEFHKCVEYDGSINKEKLINDFEEAMRKEQKNAEWSEDSVKFEEGFKAGRESGLRDGQKYVLDNFESYGLCEPAEWSEEDEEILRIIINRVEQFDKWATERGYPLDDPTLKQKPIDWLESLENRGNFPKSNTNSPSWKPSEELMEALRISFEIGTANESWAMRILKSLYNDLKKLL